MTLNENIDDIPYYLICPISGELMTDPVILDRGEHFEGHTYDRKYINKWIHSSLKTPNKPLIDPKSGTLLGLKPGLKPILTPNHNLRLIISEWLEKNPNDNYPGLIPLTYKKNPSNIYFSFQQCKIISYLFAKFMYIFAIIELFIMSSSPKIALTQSFFCLLIGLLFKYPYIQQNIYCLLNK